MVVAGVVFTVEAELLGDQSAEGGGGGGGAVDGSDLRLHLGVARVALVEHRGDLGGGVRDETFLARDDHLGNVTGVEILQAREDREREVLRPAHEGEVGEALGFDGGTLGIEIGDGVGEGCASGEFGLEGGAELSAEGHETLALLVLEVVGADAVGHGLKRGGGRFDALLEHEHDGTGGGGQGIGQRTGFVELEGRGSSLAGATEEGGGALRGKG